MIRDLEHQRQDKIEFPPVCTYVRTCETFFEARLSRKGVFDAQTEGIFSASFGFSGTPSRLVTFPRPVGISASAGQAFIAGKQPSKGKANQAWRTARRSQRTLPTGQPPRSSRRFCIYGRPIISGRSGSSGISLAITTSKSLVRGSIGFSSGGEQTSAWNPRSKNPHQTLRTTGSWPPDPGRRQVPDLPRERRQSRQAVPVHSHR